MNFRLLTSFALASTLTPVLRAQSAPAPTAGEPPTLLPSVVITAGRVEQAVADIAPRVEVVTTDELNRTPGLFLTDLIKKNASVDIIEYPGGLSGVGLRGFRPEFSGTNQRVLILVDGRAAGTTSLGNLAAAGLGRIEVLKGSASALYGSSAMGGVVNFLSRDSRGPLRGTVMLGAGSFETVMTEVQLGGQIGASAFDFDLGYQSRHQHDDFQLGRQSETIGTFRRGGGVERPNTAFDNQSGYARLGWQFAPGWRAEFRSQVYLGHDIESPGAESDLTNSQASNRFDVVSGDLRLVGSLEQHSLLFVAHGTEEYAVRRAETAGLTPYRQSIRSTTTRGLQAQDSWRLHPNYTVLFGADYELVKNDGKTYATTGNRTRPSSPNDSRETYGVFAEATAKWLADRLIVNAGVRHDEATNTIRATPLLPTVLEGSSDFQTTNPRAGVVYKPFTATPVRLHASAGRGFVAPLGNQLAGLSDETVSGQRRIQRGNPDLKPESARTYDVGVGYESALWGADVTWFRTEVSDRIETVFLSNTTTLRESTWVNASGATASGVEASLEGDFGRLWSAPARHWTASASATYFDQREQQLAAGPSPIRNVARAKVNLALTYDDQRRFHGRIGVRHVRGMIDQDNSRQLIFTGGRGGLFEYPSFVVWDADFGWRVTPGQELGVQVENVFDRYYYEKNDYPFPGRSIYARYRFRF